MSFFCSKTKRPLFLLSNFEKINNNNKKYLNVAVKTNKKKLFFIKKDLQFRLLVKEKFEIEMYIIYIYIYIIEIAPFLLMQPKYDK